ILISNLIPSPRCLLTFKALIMNEVQRHNEILSFLDSHRVINVSHITEQFSVSPATARRDISKLDEQGKLRIRRIDIILI
ncbi:DeoR family transcriptional regulator, partial [Klebsiella pneumoniae]|uniref:DeoR family transcriptional regulator n=1 Tax=Klebsiella pneumoniae TaxID=573 RepID=UPI00396984A6